MFCKIAAKIFQNKLSTANEQLFVHKEAAHLQSISVGSTTAQTASYFLVK